MKARGNPLAAFLEYPPAWMLTALVITAAFWLGQETTNGMIVAAGISVFYMLTVVMLAVARHRLFEIRVRLDDCRCRAETFKALVENTPAAIWFGRDTGERTYTSQAWTDLTGQERAEARENGWNDVVHADDLPRWESAQRVARVSRQPYEIEYRVRRTDGEYGWVLDRVTPQLNGRGAVTGFVGVTIDIADRKREGADQGQRIADLCGSNEELDRKTHELTNRYELLEQHRRKIEQSDEIKADFLAALSADLRDPIEEVRHAAELLAASDLTDQQVAANERVKKAADALCTVYGRAVELSQDGDDKPPLDVTEIDLRDFIEEASARINEVCKQRKFRLTCIVGDRVPALVRTDAVRLREIILECWETALERVDTCRPVIRVSRESRLGSTSLVYFSLILGSSSLPQSVFDRVFYPARSMRGEPSGLGLGHCKARAEEAGWSLGVMRQDNGSITFWVSASVEEVDPAADGRRQHGRLSQEFVTTDIGQVLDLSLGGMRVACRKPAYGVLDLKLSDDSDSMDLKAQVAWSNRVGFRRHEVGLKFVDVDPEVMARLNDLAIRNRLRCSVPAA